MQGQGRKWYHKYTLFRNLSFSHVRHQQIHTSTGGGSLLCILWCFIRSNYILNLNQRRFNWVWDSLSFGNQALLILVVSKLFVKWPPMWAGTPVFSGQGFVLSLLFRYWINKMNLLLGTVLINQIAPDAPSICQIAFEFWMTSACIKLLAINLQTKHTFHHFSISGFKHQIHSRVLQTVSSLSVNKKISSLNALFFMLSLNYSVSLKQVIFRMFIFS